MSTEAYEWRVRGGAALGLVVATLIACASVATPVRAAGGWSTPRLIFSSPSQIGEMDLAVDAYGRTHAVWVAGANFRVQDSSSTLFYQRLDLPDAVPLELAVGEVLSGPSIATGANDEVFVNILGNLALRTPSRGALGLRSWKATPGTVDALRHGHVAADRVGNVWLAYTEASGESVLLQRWRSESETWDAPVVIAQTETGDTAAEDVRIAFGPDDAIHVTWGEYLLPQSWPPTGVYYARSNDHGKTWTSRQDIALGPYDQPNLAVGPSGEVIIMWNAWAAIGGRYMRLSPDRGLTWSQVSTVAGPGKGGTEGFPSIAIDDRGVVHVLTSYSGCAMYLALTNGRWSTPVCISASPNVPKGILERPKMTLGLGNQLHALFFANDTKLFYSTLDIEIPGASVLPTPMLSAATPAASVIPQYPGVASKPTSTIDRTLPMVTTNEAEFMLAGALAPLALVMLVVLFIAIRTRA